MGAPKKDIQFRVLPRTNEAPKGASKKERPAPVAKKIAVNPMLRTYAVVGIAIMATFYALFLDSQPAMKTVPPENKTVQDDGSPEALVNRYLQEADARHHMAAKNSELENKISSRPLGPDAAVIPENDRQLGVSLEQENSADKIYNEIYGNGEKAAPSPEDRINMKLKEDQWMAATEKQERKQYIQNFLREAYDAGYAIDLDENLVVVRVKKVTSRPKESLDKVLENLARKGY